MCGKVQNAFVYFSVISRLLKEIYSFSTFKVGIATTTTTTKTTMLLLMMMMMMMMMTTIMIMMMMMMIIIIIIIIILGTSHINTESTAV